MPRRITFVLSIIFFLSLYFVLPSKTFAANCTSTEDCIRDRSLTGCNLLTNPPVCTVFAPSPTSAPEQSATSGDDLNVKLQEFCAKRTGNQMNLETWYSGKCTDDTFGGEGVGFSDIVILDLAEKIMGERDPNKTFDKVLENLMLDMSKVISSNTLSIEQKQIALNNLRQNVSNSGSNTPLSKLSSFMAGIIQNPPASAYTYVAYVSQNLKSHRIIPEALAAPAEGTGFSTMSVFLPLWKVTRNLAYLLMVFVFIAYGFMMMFRVNLGQKTVISIQLAIPKLAVTFIAITFSFAIVGLLMDLMWVLISFIYVYLGTQNIISLKGNLLVGSASGKVGIVASFITNVIVTALTAPVVIVNLIFGGTTYWGFAFMFIARPLGFLFSLFVAIAIIFSYFKLFKNLLVSFVSLIVSLITGPIIILGNVFPGSNSIGTWFRNVLANVAVFPTTMILLLFSYILIVQPLLGACPNWSTTILNLFSDEAKREFPSVCEWVMGVKNLSPNNMYINTIPLITPLAGTATGAGFRSDAILGLMGIMLLLMSSKYVDMVKDALKVPPFKYGTAIGESLKAGWQGIGMVPSVGDAAWYKKASQLANIKAGTPITSPPPTTTTPLTP